MIPSRPFVVLLLMLMPLLLLGEAAFAEDAAEEAVVVRAAEAPARRWTPVQVGLHPRILSFVPPEWDVRGLRLGLVSKNHEVSGVDLNLWVGSTERRLNGIAVAPFVAGEEQGNGVFLSLASYFVREGRGIFISGLICYTMEGIEGLQVSGLANGASQPFAPHGAHARGVQAAGIFNSASGCLSGLQLALVNSARTAAGGLQLGAVNSLSVQKYPDGHHLGFVDANGETTNGLPDDEAEDDAGEATEAPRAARESSLGAQVGVTNQSTQNAPLRGLQLGVLNMGAVGGAQMGVINVAENRALTTAGLQFGVYNSSPRHRGVQFGFVNHAKHRDGVRIGLLNFREGRMGWPLLDF